MLAGNCANHQVSLLECVFGTQKNVFRYPERLYLDKSIPCFALLLSLLRGSNSNSTSYFVSDFPKGREYFR